MAGNMVESRLRKAASLFCVFSKIGAFTFGGGYAMIPLIQKEVVEKKGWMSDEDILEVVAIAESTPGPIAINAATFVGFRRCGFLGALCATLGVVLPSFLIILGISYVLNEFRDIKVIGYAFNGIRAGVLALIIKALWMMYKKCPKSPVSYIVMAAAFAAAAFFKAEMLLIIIGCGLFGLVSHLILTGRKKNDIS